MIDIKDLRADPDKYRNAAKAKQFDPKLIDDLLKIDGKRIELIKKVEDLRAKRNQVAKKKGDKGREEGREIKEVLVKLEPELKTVEIEYKNALNKLPYPPAEDVKIGKDESENEVIKKWGKPKKFSFKPKDHLELGEALDIIDVKRASKVSGPRFGYLKGDAVKLEFALINFAFEFLIKEGFIPIVPPVLIKKDMMAAMGYLEHGGEDEMYVLEKDNLVLVGTSEQTIGTMHAGEILKGDELPKRYVGFSTCFRREAGSYGKDTKGIFRVHQFDKVEMFSFTKQEESDKEHEYLLSLEEKIFQLLEIPYQVLKMCSGDLGLPFSRKYDLEAWFPVQGRYREVTSTSNANDFQSRRLNTRYQDKEEIKYIHMLNGTALSIGRPIIAIMENYQQKDGSIKIPKVLQKWFGEKTIKSQS